MNAEIEHINLVVVREGRWYVRPHILYIIQNSWRPLRGLSHSVIIFQNARSPYQRDFVAQCQWSAPLPRQHAWRSCHPDTGNKTFGKQIGCSNLLHIEYLFVTPASDATDVAAPLTEWALNTLVSMPALERTVLSHLAIVEDGTGLWPYYCNKQLC